MADPGKRKGGGKPTDPPAVFFSSAAELETWMEAHHGSEEVLTVGLYRKETGRQGFGYNEMLDIALCFGWIDGVRRSLDDGRWTIRLTPRKPRSRWSRVNIGKAQALIAAGRMRPEGLAAFEARDAERSEVYSFEQAMPELEAAEAAEFQAQADAWAYWQGRSASYRRTTTWWVVSAKKPETRRRRLDTLIECSARHTAIPAMTPLSRRTPSPEE